jgi:hypothetical protein
MRPLLPPRGLFIQTDVLFSDMQPVLRDTWIQLRALAWGQDETPPISIKEIASLTRKSEKTIYGHLAILRSSGALRWHPSHHGTIIVEFRNCRFSCEDEISKFSEVDNSENLELPVNVFNNNNKESLIDDSFNAREFSENLEKHSENSENSKKSEFRTLRDAEDLYCRVTGFVTVPMGIVPYLEKILDMIQKLGEDETLARMTNAWNGWLKGRRKDNGAGYGRTNPAWIDFAIAGDVPGVKREAVVYTEQAQARSDFELEDQQDDDDISPDLKMARKEWNTMKNYVISVRAEGILQDFDAENCEDSKKIWDEVGKLRVAFSNRRR